MTSPEKKSTTNEKSEELRTIFTEEEIRNTVKAFTLGFFRGTLVIHYNNVQDIIQIEKEKGNKISYEEAETKELDGKSVMMENLKIVSGSIESTNNELNSAIKTIFNSIINLRVGHRISGTFLEFDVEKRIDQMEEKISATNKVVEEFVNWFIETEKGNEKGVSD